MSKLTREDEYFLQKEEQMRAAYRAELETKAKAAAERRRIGEQIGVTDEAFAERIRAVGFDGDNAKVLHLMPLIEVAWADGKLSDQERRIIVDAANAHGIAPHTPAGAFLASLLEKRPADVVLDEILVLLRDLLQTHNKHVHTVVEACLNVAEASGGFLGLGSKISGEERALIEKIAGAFGEEARKLIAARLG